MKKRSFAFAIVYIKCFRTYSVYLSLRLPAQILYAGIHLPPQREARALPRRVQIHRDANLTQLAFERRRWRMRRERQAAAVRKCESEQPKHERLSRRGGDSRSVLLGDNGGAMRHLHHVRGNEKIFPQHLKL